MEIKNQTENAQLSQADAQTTDLPEENVQIPNNSEVFENFNQSSEHFAIENGKKAEKAEEVSDFEQILTKFLKKYESSKKNQENSENTSKAKPNEDFYELFPNRSLEKELSNPDFMLFCSNKRDDATYGACYKDFCSLIESIEKKAENRILSLVANKNASVGSISTAEPLSNDFFTKEQVLRMSSEQIKQNYNKIRESQQKW
ncbi:MAG: hypothetical protein IJW54_05205 [Clostridia bacterium]|nr:hypothetical protein [Clostridia bacterium]